MSTLNPADRLSFHEEPDDLLEIFVTRKPARHLPSPNAAVSDDPPENPKPVVSAPVEPVGLDRVDGAGASDEFPARSARLVEAPPSSVSVMRSDNGAAPAGTPSLAPTAPARPDPQKAESPASVSAPVASAPQEEDWLGLFVRETLETVVLAVIIFLVIRVVVQNYRIEGQSMEPNFHDGEYLLVNKLAYRLGRFTRGDVIVFRYPNDPSKDYIKRIIGLPGDTVEIRGGTLYVNNGAVEEPYDHEPMVRDAPLMTVTPGHLYVLGDNRPASADTRSWGLLPEDLVIGKAWLSLWPLTQFGVIQHPPVELNSAMAQGP